MKKIMVYLLSLALVLGSIQIGAVEAQAAPVASTKTHYGNGFDSDNQDEMDKADWENGDMFNCKWEPGNISFNDGIMEMRIDSANGHFTGGEYRTKEYFGYGFYQVSMKPIKNDGVVSSFFTYTGPSDGTTWDEIDIEFLGKDTTHVQFNYYVDGRGNHEKWYDLGFDASEEYHTYGFNWYEGGITWYVDGEPVYTAPSTDIFPSHPSKIMMNVWPGTGVDDWLNPYDGKTPLYAYYDWIAYDAPDPGAEPGSGSGSDTGSDSGSGSGTGSDSGPESPKDLTFESGWYKIISKNSGKALDVERGESENGKNVLQYMYHDAENQQWTIEKQQNGYFTIKNRKTDKVLTVEEFSTELGGNVHQWEYIGNTNQEWSIIPAGDYYKIKNRNSGYLLTVANVSMDDNANVEQYQDENGNAQLWKIECIHARTETRNMKTATCNEDGYTGDEYCAECNALLGSGNVIAKTGNHSWDGGKVTKEATVWEEGEKAYTCTVCGETKTEIIPKGDCPHEDTEVRNVKEATCGEDGYTGDIYCKICNILVEEGDKIPATEEHKWDGGKVTTAATAEADGIITYTCTECNKTREETYAANDPGTSEDKDDLAAAEAVDDLISQIGEVTLESEDSITAAQEAYRKLTEEQKKLVKNYQVLTDAENKIKELKDSAESGDGTQKPGDADDTPGSGDKPGDEDDTPGSGDKPGDADDTPGSGDKPGDADDTPGSGNKPGDADDTPGSGDKPGDADDTPGSGNKPGDTGETTGSDNKPGSSGDAAGSGNASGGSSGTQQPEMPKAGTILTDSKTGVKYKVISVSGTAGTAEYTEPANKNIKSVSIPATVNFGGISYKVTSIAKNAFKNCKKLTKVTVDSNIETIGANAFMGCTKLKSVTIGKNVKKIGAKAFYGDKKLAKITIKTRKLTAKNVGSKAFAKTSGKATVKVPKKKLKAYKTLLVKKGISRKASIKK